MLIVLISAIMVATTLYGWEDLRRHRYRVGHPRPLPRPSAALAGALAALGPVGRRVFLCTAAVWTAAGPPAVLAADPAATLWCLAGWGILAWPGHRELAAFRIRRACRTAMADMAAELTRTGAGTDGEARTVYVTRWPDRRKPGHTVIRLPAGFDPGAADLIAHFEDSWRQHPLLCAQDWSFTWRPQKARPDRYQVACRPGRADVHEVFLDGPPADTASPVIEEVMVSESALSDPVGPVTEAGDGTLRPSAWDGTAVRRLGTPVLRSLRVAAVFSGRWGRRLLRTIGPPLLLTALVASCAVWVSADPGRAGRQFAANPAPFFLALLPVLAGMAHMAARRMAATGLSWKSSTRLWWEWYILTLFEDRLSVRAFTCVCIGASVTATRSSNTVLGALLPGLACYAWTVLRFVAVSRRRRGVLDDMYAVANEQLKYPKNFRLLRNQLPRPWLYLTVSQWNAGGIPGTVRIARPAGLADTNVDVRRRLQEEWNEKAFPRGQHVPPWIRGTARLTCEKGLRWSFQWKPGVIVATPFIPADPTDVRWAGQAPAVWSKFIVAQHLDHGRFVLLDVNSESPHTLVAGLTRSGKTTVMESLVAQALLRGWQVLIADYKTHWKRWEGRHPAINDLPSQGAFTRRAIPCGDLPGIRDLLLAVVEELERRKNLAARLGVTTRMAIPEHVRPLPALFVLDEFLLMVAKDKGSAEETKERNEARDEILAITQRLAVEAAAYGIYLVIGIQRPESALMGGTLRSNLGARIVCGVFNQIDSKMALDDPHPPTLPVKRDPDAEEGDENRIPGRALIRPAPGLSIVPAQCLWFGGPDNNDDLNAYFPLPGLQQPAEGPGGGGGALPRTPAGPETATETNPPGSPSSSSASANPWLIAEEDDGESDDVDGRQSGAPGLNEPRNWDVW